MKSVSIRELKDRLSQYLRRVKAGDSVRVADRRDVVAELSPPGRKTGDPSIPDGLRALAQRGHATLAVAGSEKAQYPELKRARRPTRTAAELLDDERGPR